MQRPRVRTPVEPFWRFKRMVLVVLTIVTFIGVTTETIADFAFITCACGVKCAVIVRRFVACSES